MAVAECPIVEPGCSCVDALAFPVFTNIVSGGGNIANCSIDEATGSVLVMVNEVEGTFAQAGFDGPDAGCGGTDGFLEGITPEEGAFCAELLLDAAETALGIGACSP